MLLVDGPGCPDRQVDEIKPEGGTDASSVFAWSVANVPAKTECNEHLWQVVHGRRLHVPPALERPTAGGRRSDRGAGHRARAGQALEVTKAADIKPRPVRWLWDGRLALGKSMMIS